MADFFLKKITRLVLSEVMTLINKHFNQNKTSVRHNC